MRCGLHAAPVSQLSSGVQADRILDMGFEETVNNIVSSLPVERQTLLFSATQTKSGGLRRAAPSLLRARQCAICPD